MKSFLNSLILVGAFVTQTCLVVHAQNPTQGTPQVQGQKNPEAHTPYLELSVEQNKKPIYEEDVVTEQRVAKEQKPFTILTWQGAYLKAQNRAYLNAYQKEAKQDIIIKGRQALKEDFIETLKASEKLYDVVDMTSDEINAACDAGVLAQVSHDEIAKIANDVTFEDDFFDKGLHRCGVASMVWSSVIVFNKTAFKPKRRPKAAKDFFNVKRYPGKRALPKNPQYLLELALLADDVNPSEVYETLETEDGLKRSFKQLERIKKHIVWWSTPREAFELLKTRKASMALGYNGRAFNVIAKDKNPFGIIWDGQIYRMNYWAIVKDSQKVKSALDFIAYATTPKRLARQASWFPYGPARRSAFEFLENHPEAELSLTPFLPTYEKNFENALYRDAKWWQKNRGALDIEARFQAWLKGEPYIAPNQ